MKHLKHTIATCFQRNIPNLFAKLACPLIQVLPFQISRYTSLVLMLPFRQNEGREFEADTILTDPRSCSLRRAPSSARLRPCQMPLFRPFLARARTLDSSSDLRTRGVAPRVPHVHAWPRMTHQLYVQRPRAPVASEALLVQAQEEQCTDERAGPGRNGSMLWMRAGLAI
jgi:hypothetical protein